MKKRIIFFIVMASLIYSGLFAQSPPKNGIGFLDAIPVTFSAGQSSFTDTRNTSEPAYGQYRYFSPRTGSYEITDGCAVYYRLQTTASGDIRIHNWDSETAFTTLFLVAPLHPGDESEWGYNSDAMYTVAMFDRGDTYDFDEAGIPEYASHGAAYLHIPNLPAGTCFLIAAGYKGSNGSVRNGKIKTTIIADLSSGIPEEPDMKPEEINTCPIQYQYDQSGNRIKTIKTK